VTETEILLWVKGPAFHIATVIFVVGVVARIIEIYALGRARNLAEPRGNATVAGLRTIVMRSVPKRNALTRRAAFTETAGWIFHLGMLIVIFLAAPHILVFEEILGFSWPNLPGAVVDALSVATIIALFAILVHRLYDPVLRFLSTPHDYLTWFVTTLPMVTGYLAYHHLLISYTTMLALHILSVQLLMVIFPFTKLMHAFTLFMSRFYNGAIAGYKGVDA